MGGEQLLFIGLHHWGQLVEIADKNHFHAAEGPPAAGAVETQKGVDAVEEVGAHHADFINDDRLQIAVELPFRRGAAAGFLRRDADAKAEKRMNRLALHIHRRHAGGGQDGQALAGGAAKVLQQRRFARAGAAGEKDVRRGRFKQRERSAGLGRQLDGRLTPLRFWPALTH